MLLRVARAGSHSWVARLLLAPSRPYDYTMGKSLIPRVCLVLLGLFIVCARGAEAPSTSPTTAPSADNTWLSDSRLALQIAKSKGLDVLIMFSADGTDVDAAHLEDALNNAAFVSRVQPHFVLMRFESRATVVQSEHALALRDWWADQLEVSSLPSLVLLDTTGHAYAGQAQLAAPPAELAQSLLDLQVHRVKRDEQFAKAAKSTGKDKAVALDAGLHEIGPYAKHGYLDVMEQIVAADSDNSAHLREHYAGPVAEAHIDRVIQQEVYPLIDQSDYKDALARLTKLISDEKPPTPQMQLLCAFQAQLLHNLSDNKAAVAKLDEALALDPASEEASKLRFVRDQLAAAATQPSK